MPLSTETAIWLELLRAGQTVPAALAVASDVEAAQPGLAEAALCPAEYAVWQGFQHAVRRDGYLAGRLAAKRALALYLGTGVAAAPSELGVASGIFGQPLVRLAPRVAAGLAMEAPRVSISHSAGLAIALACPDGHPMGIDIEKLNPDNAAVLRGQFLPAELAGLIGLGLPETDGLTLTWSAKEAMGKAIASGLMTPLSVYEIVPWQAFGSPEAGLWVSSFPHFGQYRVQATLLAGFALAVCHPAKTELVLPRDRLLPWFTDTKRMDA